MWCWCAEGPSDILLSRLWSGLTERTRLQWGTQWLSVYHLLIIGALDLSRGFVSCVCCAAMVIFLRDVRWGAFIKGILLHCFTQASFVLRWGGWNIVLRQVESKFTGFWLCVCLCLRPDMNKKKKFTLPLPQVQFNYC